MALTMRTNGLQHAISLGNIEVPSKQSGAYHLEKYYDSDDENMNRRLRPSSSTELYPRTPVYSKGDIREQYCLTDRQLNTIERPRRDRFFGCLSRRGTPQSFLGVCVGRRAPSDENLAAYAPFYKYPRYQHHYPPDGKAFESDHENAYFRRQPASILSTAKMSDSSSVNRYSWSETHATPTNKENPMCSNDQRVICRLLPVENLHQDACVINHFNPEQHFIPNPSTCVHGCATHGIFPVGPSTPRTKHVSFARSHTLTSFDDANLGLRSSGRMTSTRSQERLIGGKKPIISSGSIYESIQLQQDTTSTNQSSGTQISAQHHQNMVHHPHLYGHQHGHSHAHHHGPPFHVHQIVPIYHQEQVVTPRREMVDNFTGMNMPSVVIPSIAPPSPEIVVVEKKFRNAMKTQATQTELRKDGLAQSLKLSPRTIHKVKVVSQGAQTNGLLNGKKLTKSLSEMPNDKTTKDVDLERSINGQRLMLGEHETLYRTQSEEPPRSPLQSVKPVIDSQYNVMYYNPPAPPQQSEPAKDRRTYQIPSADTNQVYAIDDRLMQNASVQSIISHSDLKSDDLNQTMMSYQNNYVNYDDSCDLGLFDYESNSLPRRACSYHRLDNDLYSNSLPRRDPMQSHDACRHITDCTELLGDTNMTDFSRQHLLPPPRQYRREDEYEEEEVELEDEPLPSHHQSTETSYNNCVNRRMSMVVTPQNNDEQYFKREDFRRQSMPVPKKPEKIIDVHFKKSVQDDREIRRFDSYEEQEILIDFKPHISPTMTTKKLQRHRKLQKSISDSEEVQRKPPVDDDPISEVVSISNAESECDEESEEKEDPVYENVLNYAYQRPESVKRSEFRKRSISLEDAAAAKSETGIGKSSPPSPCQDEMLINTSTYPSSDSLANDLTRDHSDGIWNESQVTVLTADARDQNETEHGGNLLLTPSAKRKSLILQHQQRSSIDTDALDFEDQFTDHSPTYSNLSAKSSSIQSTVVHQRGREFTGNIAVPMTMLTPTIAVTPTSNADNEQILHSPRISPSNSRRSSKSLSPAMQDIGKTEASSYQKIVELQTSGNNFGYIRSDAGRSNTNNTTDISECSTNTDDYVTCTDTSKRTPGIKTPPTTTSSSSTTQVPVSAQSSQTEKTHGGSSFESASSLYSNRGDVLLEDISNSDENILAKNFKRHSLSLAEETNNTAIRSPSHSISSTSSGSYNMKGVSVNSNNKHSKDAIAQTTTTSAVVITPATTLETTFTDKEKCPQKNKPASVSDDERSDIRYSSSGYYESPHDDDHGNSGKIRRHRLEEDRKRRRTSMKLDIEKENLRALTSPIKKSQMNTATLHYETIPDPPAANIMETTSSPCKMKRFRPKIRRQLKRTSRDESTPRRQKNQLNIYGVAVPPTSEKLLDCSLVNHAPEPSDKTLDHKTQICGTENTSTSNVKVPLNEKTAAASECYQLKAKSVESLRSVSPGSDSVFYSEADGTATDPHNHCLHCGKEMEAANATTEILDGHSVESLPGMDNDNEQNIVKPPSDFADSPVTTKTTQRLYKKMDKRFRSEERYHVERGRHHKNRQENIRAKSEERGKEKYIRTPQTLRPAGSSPCVLPDVNSEQRSQVIYRGHYDHSRYCRLTDADVWTQLDHQSFERHRDRRASTESEKSFHTKYQVILHRLVQRRCTLEMYHRQKNNMFKLISSNSSPESVRRKLEEILKLMLLVWAREGQVLSVIAKDTKHGIDKTVVVKSDSGEFGFRIHGSKPVVVAAIEPDTPAESSGLEVGDIIISVNGVQVLDKHHTEVVKIAHAGCETLELEVARTIGVLMNEQQETPSKPLFSGYLWRQSGQAKGTPNTKKWVRRWFCLRPDQCLYYYKTEEDTQPVGAMIMAKHTVEQCPLEIGKPFAFKVDSGEGIPMYVAADTEELAQQWMNVLKRSAVQGDPWLEKCARTLHQPPSGINRPDCFGYLMKLGSRWCGWSKRYCVLKDACLYFYQDANSKTAFGMACLQGYKVASMSTNASGRKNSFEIIPQESKLRHYYFSTESEMDKKRWISALEYSIDRWIKSG